MEHDPNWEANISSAKSKKTHILWNTKVQYRIHNSSYLSLSWARSTLH